MSEPNEREEAYDLIDRFLRNNLDDTDYADFSQALDLLFVAQRTEPAAPVASTAAVPEGAEAVACDPLDALMFGANVAESLLKIGRSIGFGRAQQILGEQWEAEHDCAPRGRMGVTVGKCIPPKMWVKRSQDAYRRGWNECALSITDAHPPRESGDAERLRGMLSKAAIQLRLHNAHGRHQTDAAFILDIEDAARTAEGGKAIRSAAYQGKEGGGG